MICAPIGVALLTGVSSIADFTKIGCGRILVTIEIGVDGGVEDAEAAGLPDPLLAGVPVAHVFLPAHVQAGHALARSRRCASSTALLYCSARW